MTERESKATSDRPNTNPFDQGYFRSDELRGFGFKRVGEDVRIAKNCTIIGLENISIGSNVRIDANVVITANSGSLDLGSYIHIGSGCYLGCAGGITFHDFAGLSQGISIYSATDDYSGNSLTNPTVPHEYLRVNTAPVILGKHVIIGSGSVVLPGVVIGEGSSVGALSLVTKSLDDWGVYLGTPARQLKARSKNLLQQEQRLLAAQKTVIT